MTSGMYVLRAYIRGIVVRYRLRDELLRYIATVRTMVSPVNVPARIRTDEMRLTSGNPRTFDLRLLRKLSLAYRHWLRTRGVPHLSCVIVVEHIFTKHFRHANTRQSCVWSPREQLFLKTNFVVRCWSPNSTRDTPDMKLVSPNQTSFGCAWSDGTGIVTRYRGVQLRWGHFVVCGHFIQTPHALLNAVFRNASDRVRHLQEILRRHTSMSPSTLHVICRDLSVRDILVATDGAIIQHVKRLVSIHQDPKSIPSIRDIIRDIGRLAPHELVQRMYTLVAISDVGRRRAYVRIMFEFLCTRHARENVEAIVRACLPLRLHSIVCHRMIGMGDESSNQEHKLTLAEKVQLRFQEHADILAAVQDRLREFKTSRVGTDTHGKASKYLHSVLRLPLGVIRTHPVVQKRISRFGHMSTDAVDRMLREQEQALVRTHPRLPPGARVQTTRPSLAWIQHRERVIAFRTLRREQRDALLFTRRTMDATVYGCMAAKRVVRRLVAQWIGHDAGGCVVGLEGPPGIGKTTFVREGLAQCFGDKNAPHPFEFISLGGATNNSTLVGWNYTWHTSTYGRIAASLMRHGIMNPILYFDELDKVSRTSEGREILGILTHLTDPTQNSTFEDRYFTGIPLDLSQCIIVFSFNNASAIDPVLLDRIHRIRFDPMSLRDKCEVATRFLIPRICKTMGVDVRTHTLSAPVVRHIAQRFTHEAGVRRLKELLSTVVRERNRQYLCNDAMPPISTPADANKLLTDARPSRIERVGSRDDTMIGAVNALHASASGGGVTRVQVVRVAADDFRPYRSAATTTSTSTTTTSDATTVPAWRRVAPQIMLTGRQGHVMVEAAHVAATVAAILAGAPDIHPTYFHLHCPDGGTPKDGPSAGCAFALAFYSVLTSRSVYQHMAITGEIDLLGRVLPVGGISSKITGALLHGVTLMLIPEGNRNDAERFLATNALPPDVDMYYIRTVLEAITYALVPPS